jgi:hypothetical protein
MPSAFITYLLTKNKSCGDKLSAAFHVLCRAVVTLFSKKLQKGP